MPPQYGIKLAVHIITTDFGNLVAKVCECLLRRGNLTRHAIAKYIELPDDKVIKCLWVLIQHNCVQAFKLHDGGGFGEGGKIHTHYMAVFNNIICRMRFPKFLTLVSKELDKECAFVFEGLLQHGRLTLTQILDRATDLSNGGELVRERFMKLLEARYIERCPSAEPFVSLAPANDSSADAGGPSAKNRGSKSKTGPNSKKLWAYKYLKGTVYLQRKKIVQKEGNLEDCVIAASTLMEAERFSIKTDSGKDIAENGSSKTKVGSKRKNIFLEEDDDVDISGCNKDPTWRVNFDEFKRLFRKKACVESTKTRLDDGAGIVLSAVLEANKATGNTVSLCADAIFEEVIKSEEGRTMTLEHARAFLGQLGCDSAGNDTYFFDLTEIIKCAQREEVESIVSKRYGKEAYRLFRLLADSRNSMETSGISEKTFVEHKDTRKILYKLWIDNFLVMESVRRPPQGELYYWSVNKNLNGLVLDELFHVALNLRIRVAREMELGFEVFNVQDTQNSDTKKKIRKLKAVKILLESSLAKLDDAIMLFHDF